MEERLGQRHSWDPIRTQLNRMHLGIFRGQAGVVYQRTETTPSRPSSSAPSAYPSRPASSASIPPGPTRRRSTAVSTLAHEEPVLTGSSASLYEEQLSKFGLSDTDAGRFVPGPAPPLKPDRAEVAESRASGPREETVKTHSTGSFSAPRRGDRWGGKRDSPAAAPHGFDGPAGAPYTWVADGGGEDREQYAGLERVRDPGRWDRGGGARQNSPGSRVGDPRRGVAGAVSPREGLREGRSGAIAQLGERVHGMHEVRGSSPLGSTKLANEGGTAEVSLRPLGGGGSAL